jgi:hypothetical protein
MLGYRGNDGDDYIYITKCQNVRYNIVKYVIYKLNNIFSAQCVGKLLYSARQEVNWFS